MHLRNNISRFVNGKLILFYSPVILFLIYNVILFLNINILTSSAACIIYITYALTLIPVCMKKTKNCVSVLFFSLGIFAFGIADAIWIIFQRLFNINPLSSIFLSYFYVITNLCFVAAVIMYVIINIKNLHPVQMALDITVVSLLSIGILTVLFFRVKVFGSVAVSAFDISQFLYLALDAIGIAAMIFLFISSRSEKIQIYNLMIFLGIVLFFISDSLYISEIVKGTHSYSKYIDWLYMLSMTVIVLAVNIRWQQNKDEPLKQTETLYLNEGRIKYAWLIFSVPVLIFIVSGIHTADLIIFTTVTVSYLILSLYIQKNIVNEKLLKSQAAYAEILENQIKERTRQLEILNKNLKYLIQHDSLTGILSRVRFFELIDKQIKKCQNDEVLYLITIDVDKFRVINAVYGFNIGDKVLKQISEIIKENFDNNCYIARTDSNEFSILCYGAEFEDINAKLQRIYLILQHSIKVGTFQLSVNVRIGIVEYPKNARNRVDLVNCAKASLLHARNLNQSGYYLFNDEIQSKIRRSVEIELALKKADINNEFALHYQPIYDISGKKISGIEALIRWNSPSIGQVNPGEFIQIAEETGVILSLGEWILENAMRHIKEVNRKYSSDMFIGINISPIQLKNTNFIDKVRELIFDIGVLPNWINFEITENLKITEQDEKTLTQLTSMGIILSIDDFGTGYSSYNYLNKFSFDYLKISKHLIDNITCKQKDAQIVESIITMAKILKIKVLAEGVETNQQMGMLYDMGCDYIQGFIYAKPVPFNQLLEKYIVN